MSIEFLPLFQSGDRNNSKIMVVDEWLIMSNSIRILALIRNILYIARRHIYVINNEIWAINGSLNIYQCIVKNIKSTILKKTFDKTN